jgi:hypothetical protein
VRTGSTSNVVSLEFIGQVVESSREDVFLPCRPPAGDGRYGTRQCPHRFLQDPSLLAGMFRRRCNAWFPSDTSRMVVRESD